MWPLWQTGRIILLEPYQYNLAHRRNLGDFGPVKGFRRLAEQALIEIALIGIAFIGLLEELTSGEGSFRCVCADLGDLGIAGIGSTSGDF